MIPILNMLFTCIIIIINYIILLVKFLEITYEIYIFHYSIKKNYSKKYLIILLFII
jgi:hypothetical protein